MNSNPISVFKAESEGQRHRPLSITREDPEINAVLEKLVRSTVPGTPGLRARMSGQTLSTGALQRISAQTTRNIYDAKSLMELLPDLELVREIVISLILSPKDMGPGEVQFRVNKGRFTGEVTGAMLDVVRTHFKDVYKIDDLARNMLSDAMFERGSFPVLVLPENAIDILINDPRRVSLESLPNTPEYKKIMTDYIGMLGPAEVSAAEKGRINPGTEAFGTEGGFQNYEAKLFPESAPTAGGQPVDLQLKVIDNPLVLKRSRLNTRLRADRVVDRLKAHGMGPRLLRSDKVNISLESILASQFTGGEGGIFQRAPGQTNNINLSLNSMYRSRQQSGVHMQVIPTPSETSRGSIGHPLVINLPAEAVLPLHVPGDPKDHIGYFVLLDENHNPVSRESSFNYFAEMGDALQQQNSMPQQVIQSVRRATNGTQQGNQEQRYTIQELEQSYAAIVEADLHKRLRNGVVGGNVTIARPQEVYRLMLTRSFQQRQTQLLYVPAEMMTYVAFDYNEYGIGVSMLQKSMIIGGMRAALQFANVQAGMKNAIARTRLKINLAPEDPDPEQTIEEFIHNYVRTSRGMMPIGVVDPNDILSYMAQAAVEVEVSGNNPNYPETSMMVEDTQSNVNKPDTELEDSLKARHHMMFGLTPEMVDQAKGAEFATTLVQQNLLLSKRVYQWQNEFTPFLTDHVQCYTINSGPLLDELRKVVLDNRDKLTRSQLNDQREAVSDGEVDVDEDLRNMVQVLSKSEAGKESTGNLTDDQQLAVDAVVYEFIQSLTCELPRPDTAAQTNQSKAFEDFKSILTAALDAYISPDVLGAEFMGELADSIEPTKKALEAYFIRQWLADNNVLPELMDLTMFNPNEGPALDLLKIQSGHLEGLRQTIMGFVEKNKIGVAKINQRMEQINSQMGTDNAGGGSSFDTGSTDTGGDSTFDFGEDLGGGETGLGNVDETTNVEGTTETDAGGTGGAADEESGEGDDAAATTEPTL